MMIRLGNVLRRFRRDDEGATLVEYGIALLIAVGVGTFVVTNISADTSAIFGEAAECLSAGAEAATGEAGSTVTGGDTDTVCG